MLTILQNENKMKAAPGKNVKISLSKEQTKRPAVKEVPTDITDNEFKEFQDLHKISYAKAERLKSEKDGGVLPYFLLKLTTLPKPRFSSLKI